MTQEQFDILFNKQLGERLKATQCPQNITESINSLKEFGYYDIALLTYNERHAQCTFAEYEELCSGMPTNMQAAYNALQFVLLLTAMDIANCLYNKPINLADYCTVRGGIYETLDEWQKAAQPHIDAVKAAIVDKMHRENLGKQLTQATKIPLVTKQ